MPTNGSDSSATAAASKTPAAAANAAPAATPTAAAAARNVPPPTKITVADLKTSYCNMASTNITREEFVLNFGVNQNWERPENAEVSLQHRIILSPFLAKNYLALLTKAVADYESRFGALG